MTKKLFIILGLVLILLLSNYILIANHLPFVRYPAPSPDGSKIAFSFQGDIWTVSIDGGRAKRLTIHQAYESFPKWNKDGSKIAFSSNRFGNNDVFIIPKQGGIPKRITYHSANDNINQWHNDSILFSTARLFKQVERINEIYVTNENGGTPKRLLDSLGDMPVMSPDGKKIAFVRGTCRIEREAYRGSANRDIWMYDLEKKTYTKLTLYDGNDFYPHWKDNDTILFISSSSGKYNIHSLQITDTPGIAIRQLTFFKDFGVRYFDISLNKKIIVMEVKTSIYTLELNETKPKLLNIAIGSDYRFDPIERKTYRNKVSEYALSPNEKLISFVIRGEVFIKENNKKKSRTINISNNPFRDEDTVWLSDDKLMFISDRYGSKNIFMVISDDVNEKNIFKTLKRKIVRITDTKFDEHNLLISPNRKKLAFLRDNGQLVVADITDDGNLLNEKILLNGWATPRGISWSPDSLWLAYSIDNLNFNKEIFIHKADNSIKPVNISMHPRPDTNPIWSKDGLKLGFTSSRKSQNNDIWFVWLRKQDWEKTKQEWEEEKDSALKNNKGKEKTLKTTEIKPIKIDIEGIYERLVQVTALPGDETNFAISKDGKTFYFTTSSPENKGTDVYSVKWDGTKLKRLTKNGKNPTSLTLDKKSNHMYMVSSKGELSKLSLKTKKQEQLPFNAKMIINHPKENTQMFNEASKILTKKFYDPKFHGKDWEKIKKDYKNLVLDSSTFKDFVDMFNIMLGQLNASHMGLYGKDREKTQRDITGLLGVEIAVNDNGALIKRVILNSPADKVKSKLNKNDVIIAIDGVKINKDVNFYSLLNNKVNEAVLLEVKSRDNIDNIIRNVVIRPTKSLRKELYEQWVKDRKNLTEKYSNGRLGYLHIKGMNMVSFERFEREITSCGYGKEGIVIDVRFNGGGWTTDYLMAVLNVKQHSYTIPRGASDDLQKEHIRFRDYYAFGERLPFAVWTKPSIAICNANSYSNAEIFSHAYKTLGIGKLVGIPTFGAVISTGGARLLNGSFVRVPFRGWYVKATDKNMEHKPAVPDVIVQNSPDSKAKGVDEQLKKAVNVLLKQINKKNKNTASY